jgi:hypothetical protein
MIFILYNFLEARKITKRSHFSEVFKSPVKTIFAACVFQNRFFVVIVVARVALLILNIIRYGP